MLKSIQTRLTATLGSVLGLADSSASPAPIPVFSTSLVGELSSRITPGRARLTGVQGFAGQGPAGNRFGGSFLRSAIGNVVTLKLSHLPAHNTINLAFVFAAKGSFDGTGTVPADNFFKIVLDGATLFSESFTEAKPDPVPSYAPPVELGLARHQNLGAEPRLAKFEHMASSAEIQLFIFGEDNPQLNDEAWVIDNLTVSVSTRGPLMTPVPEPASWALMPAGLLAQGRFAPGRKQAVPEIC